MYVTSHIKVNLGNEGLLLAQVAERKGCGLFLGFSVNLLDLWRLCSQFSEIRSYQTLRVSVSTFQAARYPPVAPLPSCGPPHYSASPSLLLRQWGREALIVLLRGPSSHTLLQWQRLWAKTAWGLPPTLVSLIFHPNLLKGSEGAAEGLLRKGLPRGNYPSLRCGHLMRRGA